MNAGSFDRIASNLAEVIDNILVAERSRERRIDLIRHQVRHAITLGYKTGIDRGKESEC